MMLVNPWSWHVFLGEFVLPQIPRQLFWPYFAGASISLAGVAAIRGDVLLARGSDKIVSLGRLFYAMPMAVFGAEHFTEAKSIVQLIPTWIPGKWFWVFFVGVALLAASVSIVANKQVRLSAFLLGLMFFLFVMLMHIPGVVANPRDRIAWAIALRDLAFSGGALALAGMQTEAWRTKGKQYLVTVGRTFILVTTLVFGVEQILHPDVVPGVPLERQTPAWIPGHIFWSYLAGAVFLAAGACLLLNRKARMAATVVGAMVLVLMVFVYTPILIASVSDIGNGLNYFADTLAFSGAVLLLADAMPKEENPHA
jgi:uncharacterized membrane protein YphA (DoxX/SURF4 family)